MISSKTIKWCELSAEDKAIYRQYTSIETTYKNPFYQTEFIDAVANVKSFVYVLILYKEHRPFLFFPYQYKNRISKIMGLAERVGSHMSDFFGPVIEPNTKVTQQELMKFAQFTMLNFDHLPSFDHQFNVAIDDQPIASQIIINENAEAYFEWLKSYNKKFYSDTLRRTRKAIESLGEIKYNFNNKCPEELERLITKKREQYARTEVSDALSESWKLDLLNELMTSQTEHFEVVLSTIYCGETWLASHLGLKANGILQYWLPVYDTEHKNYAPGRLLLFANIEALQANGVNVIDRGEGLSDAKKDTANFLYQMGKGSLVKKTPTLIFSKLLQKYYWNKSSH